MAWELIRLQVITVSGLVEERRSALINERIFLILVIMNLGELLDIGPVAGILTSQVACTYSATPPLSLPI